MVRHSGWSRNGLASGKGQILPLGLNLPLLNFLPLYSIPATPLLAKTLHMAVCRSPRLIAGHKEDIFPLVSTKIPDSLVLGQPRSLTLSVPVTTISGKENTEQPDKTWAIKHLLMRPVEVGVLGKSCSHKHMQWKMRREIFPHSQSVWLQENDH